MAVPRLISREGGRPGNITGAGDYQTEQAETAGPSQRRVFTLGLVRLVDLPGLACGLEHGRFERLARRFAGPDHELERRIITLARFERCCQQRLALPSGSLDASGQHERMPEHHQSVLAPEIKMPDPHLLVDQRGQQLHFGAAALRRLDLERASEMQRFDVVHPGKGDLVVGPLAAYQDRYLVLAGALERPVIGRRHTLDYFERVSSMICYF